MDYGAFIFDHYAFDQTMGVLHLRYRYENGPVFEERLEFPPAHHALNAVERAALDAAFRLAFLLAGVSYYKAYVPGRLRCDAFALDRETAAFVEKTYRKGLAEFAYRNKLDLSDRVKFEASEDPPPRARPIAAIRRALVPVGGGKDSIVTLETLKAHGESLTLFALGGADGPAAPIKATIRESALPDIAVARTLSPTLMEINKAGAFNGHVPITAILSAIAVACAVLCGFDSVIMSNEHSASAPNLRIGEAEINHQYSKSFAFEMDFASYVASHIAPDISYFSLLRPLTEAEIARRFSKLENYHAVFRSCNAAFKQDAAARATHWCRQCPKCRFVFLALAPFVKKEKLVAIFGADLLGDAAQQQGFAELVGASAFKPFECVGEVEESAALLTHLAESGEWKDEPVVKALAPALPKTSFDDLFRLRDDHAVPDRYRKMLDARG